MLLTISNVLNSEELVSILQKIEELEWIDGKSTAGKTAKSVKYNQQAVLTHSVGAIVHDEILGIIDKNPVLNAAAQPKAFTRLMISKTEGGGHYGAHVDNALMNVPASEAGPKVLIRTDMSFTLFLSDPSNYEGGELLVQYPGFSQHLKPQAGDLVLYPSRYIHEVKPVTNGQRLACVGWIESLIPREDHREVLFDLINLRMNLSQNMSSQSVEIMTLNKSISNLLRLWVYT